MQALNTWSEPTPTYLLVLLAKQASCCSLLLTSSYVPEVDILQGLHTGSEPITSGYIVLPDVESSELPQGL